MYRNLSHRWLVCNGISLLWVCVQTQTRIRLCGAVIRICRLHCSKSVCPSSLSWPSGPIETRLWESRISRCKPHTENAETDKLRRLWTKFQQERRLPMCVCVCSTLRTVGLTTGGTLSLVAMKRAIGLLCERVSSFAACCLGNTCFYPARTPNDAPKFVSNRTHRLEIKASPYRFDEADTIKSNAHGRTSNFVSCK